jgi:hypothetical protein
MPRYFFTSLTRISNLREVDFHVAPMSREHWASGDYVVGEVNARPSQVSRVELSTGRTIEVMEGSLIVGAFGKRYATLEVVGDWRAIGADLEMEVLGTGGVLGKLTSKSPLLPPRISLTYQGHAVLDGRKISMSDFIPKATNHKFKIPSVLITGTSMSAGKTTTARVLIRILKESNLKVLGVKLAGSGHYRDILGMRDAGADHIFDFVDVGLPTTVCSEEEYRKAIKLLLSHIAQVKADIAVLEIGASPMEPYNGALAVKQIEEHVVFSILCASDPYAVVGMIHAYGKKPDLVAGVATSTEAGTELIESISGIRALNLLDREAQWKLREMLIQQVPVFPENH